MEQAGIHTIRGDINREILANNAVIEMARAAYEQTKKPYAETVVNLSAVEVLEHNKRDLERMLENESLLVNFVFKEDSPDGIKEKTKKLIWAEATGKEILPSNCMQINQVMS